MPRELREEHGDEILDHVRREREDPRFARGWSGELRFRLWLVADLLATRRRLARDAAALRDRSFEERRARLGGLANDLRHAWRAARATPVQSAIVVLTLGVGIGLGTSVFALVHDALLEPLGHRDPDRLLYVFASWREPELADLPLTGLDFADVRERSKTLADVAAGMRIRQNLTGVEVPLQVEVGWVSPNVFELLGASAGLGRVFTSEEPPGTVVLSDAFWRTVFAGDTGVLGRTVRLDGRPYTIVGVAPRGFRLHLPTFETPIDVWKSPDDAWENGDVWRSRQAHQFRLVARMRDGVTVDDARHELSTLAAELRAEHAPHARSGFDLHALPLAERAVADSRTTLLVLMGAVGFLGLVACANVANLMLVRGRARAAEVATRAALGAGRGGLVRLFLLESALLAALGGALGIGVAIAGRSLLEPWRPAALRGDGDPLIDLPVFAFALAATAACVLASGIAPALAGSRLDVQAALRLAGTRVTRRDRRYSDALVVVQIALSLVLVTGAVLLVTSLFRLERQDPGFDAHDLYTFSVSLPGTRYEWPGETDTFFRSLEDELLALPGFEAAGVVWPAPLSGRSWTGSWESDGAAVREGLAHYRLATPQFFEAAGVRVVEGRVFGAADARNTVVVSRSLAELLWPGRPAIGQTLVAAPWSDPSETFSVVGVVEDVRYDTLRAVTYPQIYFDSRGWSWADWEVDVVVRSSLDWSAAVGMVRNAVARLDPEIPVARARPLGAYVEEELAPHRFAFGALGLFAFVSAGLAALGLYGLLATSVLERGREIGIRLALGCERAGVLWMVLGTGLRLTALGLALGWLGSLWLGRSLERLLFEVEASEPAVLLAASAALLLTAVCAAWLPARRATRLDPLAVLRG